MGILNFRILLCCLSITVVSTYNNLSAMITSWSDNIKPSSLLNAHNVVCIFYTNYCTFNDRVRGILRNDCKINLNEVNKDNIINVYGIIVNKLISDFNSSDIKNELKFDFQECIQKYNIINNCYSKSNSKFEDLLLKVIDKTLNKIFNDLFTNCFNNGKIDYNDKIKKQLESIMLDFINKEKSICNSAQETVTDFNGKYYNEYTKFGKRSGLRNNSYYDTYINSKKIIKLTKCNIEQLPFNFAYAIVRFKSSNNNQNELIFSLDGQQNTIKYEIPRNDLLKQSISLYKKDSVNSALDNTRNELFKLVRQYHNYVGKSQILDDEFKILCTLVIKASEVCNKITIEKYNINKIDVEIFTFMDMDMFPSCWIAWKKMFPYLQSLYKELLNVNELELQVNVYSIKPFYDKYHFFTEKYYKLNENSTKDSSDDRINIEKWCEASLPYRRYKECTNNNLCFSQSIDMDGVQIIQNKFKEEHNEILYTKKTTDNNANTEKSTNKQNTINIDENLEEGKIDNKKDKHSNNNEKKDNNKKKKE